MKKLTFLLMLVALLVSSTAIVYAGFAWAGDPQVMIGGNTLVRILVTNEVSNIQVGTGGEGGRIVASHGYSVTIKENSPRKVCANGPFAVRVSSSGFSSESASGGCISGW